MLVDTNVISELMRAKPEPRVRRWAEGQRRIAVSVITIEEVYFGLGRRENARLEAWFERFVEAHCDVLSVTPRIARRGAELRALLARHGQSRTQADMLIAATASSHDLILATRNTKDFEGCGVRVVNPFAVGSA